MSMTFFLCFSRSICIINIKKFSKNFQVILEDKPMMNYCMECGTKLELRHLENEGEIPFCSQCNQFRFPIFNTAVSMICIDVKNQKILLIKQYGRPDSCSRLYFTRGRC